ncbi:TetR/AcrR family transcriptional regulator [Nocardia sp. NPDC058176]|uniref:TetR/AcrR family transcriptional regulator n=1 Tax=Nocardia sp. NPDC058176 TaxID=3346368 RepID=UPI0036DF7446
MTTSSDEDLPKAVQLMWGMQESGGRGPKRGLTLDQILDAATEVADAEGFAALSMNRVARQLGFTAMSLYRYVDSKDTLIDLLMDRVVGPPPEIAPGMPWRVGLEQWAFAEFARIGRHSWWLDIPMSHAPMGPNNMAWLETALQVLAEVDVPDPVKFQLVMNMSMFVVGKRRFLRDLQEDEGGDFVSVMTQVLDPQRFPAVTAALSASAFDDDDVDWEQADFAFGLARLLDGYEVFIAGFGD